MGRYLDGGAWDTRLISGSCPSGIGQTRGHWGGPKDLQGEGNWPSAFQVE